MDKKKRKQQAKKGEIKTVSWSEKVDIFFKQNEKILVFLTMFAGLVLCILLFDVKVSFGGDDSDYLIFAEDFWHHFRYPGYHGALYPIVISPIVGLFGYKLVLLKSISCIFMLAFLWFFYKSFRSQVSDTILYPTLLLIGFNSYIFFYAAQTYSEALFMLIQALFFWYFFKHFIAKKEHGISLKSDWKKFVVLGCLILMMGLTRTIGYGAIGALILFFAVSRRWKELIYSTVAFVILFVFFQSLKYLIWPDSGTAYNISTFMAKDYYNPIERESVAGFINRFVVNSQTYLSNFLCQFLGIVQDRPSIYVVTNTPRTIILYLCFFGSLVILFRKNNALLFSGIYVGVMLFVSFIILHTIWGQDRLILVFYPYILIFLLGGIYYLFQIRKFQKFFFVYPLIIILLFFGTLSITKQRVERNIPVLQENLLGDQLYGLTPDWINFISGSQWATKNLDKNAVIVSRKPSISKVYSGRDFSWAPTDMTVPYDSLAIMQNTDTHSILIVDKLLESFDVKYIVNFQESFTFNNTKIMAIMLIYLIPNADLEEIIHSCQNRDIKYIIDYQSFFANFQNMYHRIYDPDMMLNYLTENNIRYLLLPQLRLDPTQKTGQYINNTHRFVWFISYKYPDRFALLHTEGKEEPCEIVEFLRK